MIMLLFVVFLEILPIINLFDIFYGQTRHKIPPRNIYRIETKSCHSEGAFFATEGSRFMNLEKSTGRRDIPISRVIHFRLIRAQDLGGFYYDKPYNMVSSTCLEA